MYNPEREVEIETEKDKKEKDIMIKHLLMLNNRGLFENKSLKPTLPTFLAEIKPKIISFMEKDYCVTFEINITFKKDNKEIDILQKNEGNNPYYAIESGEDKLRIFDALYEASILSFYTKEGEEGLFSKHFSKGEELKLVRPKSILIEINYILNLKKMGELLQEMNLSQKQIVLATKIFFIMEIIAL